VRARTSRQAMNFLKSVLGGGKEAAPKEPEPAAPAPRDVSRDELAAHDGKSAEPWLAVHGNVYNVTRFVKLHPGGADVLKKVAGTDATGHFNAAHPIKVLDKWKVKLLVGPLK
jgi:cytochrome b involved in lipid metabolism